MLFLKNRQRNKVSFLGKTGRVSCFLFISTLIIGMLLTACSQASSSFHQTYSYHPPSGFNGSHQPGDHILVGWTAQSGDLTNDTTPAKILFSVELVGGPFSSVDAMLRAEQQSRGNNNFVAKEAIVASAQPIQTDNWTNKSFTSSLIIPVHLQAGYYDLLLYTITIYSGKKSETTRNDALFSIN